MSGSQARNAMAAGLLLLASSDEAWAQRLTGMVEDRISGRPVPAAVVSLLDRHERVVTYMLTSPEGRFLLTAPDTGTFRIRAELIGFRTEYTDWFRTDGQTAHAFRLVFGEQAIPLAAIQVTGERNCAIRSGASDVLHVWTEARKALAAAAAAERDQLLSFSGVTWQRTLRADGQILEQVLRPYVNRTTTPYRALPAEELHRDGYVRQDGDSWQYFAPSAEVLLSPVFEESQCFSLVRSATAASLVGVQFAPHRQARDVPLIAGTVWIDAGQARLTAVDFYYVNTGSIPWADQARGRVEFRALPSGAWAVSRWWIRTPSAVQQRAVASRLEYRVMQLTEIGGEIRSVTAQGRRWNLKEPAVVTGELFDSAAARPLVGAFVMLGGTALSGRTDAGGRFRIAGVPPGSYSVDVAHPRLDSLPPPGPIWPAITVAAGSAVDVVLGVPRTGADVAALCARQEQRPGAGIHGVVRDSVSGRPLGGARLRLLWEETSLTDRFTRTRMESEVQVDGNGRFLACGLPRSTAVEVHVALMSGARWQTVLTTPRTAGTVILAVNEAAALAVRLDSMRIAGRVVEGDAAEAVPDATVYLMTADLQILGEVRTTLDGDFSFANLSAGTYLLQSSYEGRYSAVTRPFAPPARPREPVVLVVPSALEQLLAPCSMRDVMGGSIAGLVYDRNSGVPVPGAAVRVGRDPAAVTATTDAGGRYVICNVPAGSDDVVIRAFGRDLVATLPREREPRMRVDFPVQVTPERSSVVVLGRSPLSPDLAGAVLQGRILWIDGEPLASAEVRVAGGAPLITAEDGRFAARDLDGGETELEIQHVAAGRIRQTVTLAPGHATVIELRLERSAIALAPLEVMAERAGALAARRTAARLAVAAGAQLAEAEARGASLTSIIQRFPGLRVAVGRFTTSAGSSAGVCVTSTRPLASLAPRPADWCEALPVYVDNLPVHDPVSFLRDLTIGDYESIELITAVEAQTRFGMEAAAAGGALILWTRGRGPHASSARDTG